ncbi:indoleamine 2,3-dioxygenase, partial [Phenoliferia sp. Uapishka_3]
MSTPPRTTNMGRHIPFPIFDEPASTSALPANHFLAQRPVTPPPQSSVIAEQNWSSRARPDTSTLAAADYDVSVQTGFLPPEEPVQRLGSNIGGGWEKLEEYLRSAQEAVRTLDGGGVGRIGDEWRASVRELKQPSLDVLPTLPLLRRAHVLLSFLGHFYIHSTFPSLSSLPPAIAVPWVAVSDKLGVPPILSYADTVLWNWKYVNKSLGLRADNVEITTTFTSSSSERAFFLLSLLCELHAPALLRLMSATLDESFFADQLALPRISAYLLQIASITDELTGIVTSATKGPFGPHGDIEIIPECFYWEIRPWFNGGKWFYEGVITEEADVVAGGKQMEWGGPSAGQSSLIHAIDLFLSIDHSPRVANSTSSHTTSAPMPPPMRPLSVEKRPDVPASDSTFMIRASQYMPGHHRSFLQHLSSLHLSSSSNTHPIPSVRTLALTHRPQLGESYDVAVRAMKVFRDLHMRLVSVFIITQAKKPPGHGSVFYQGWEEKRLESEREKAMEAERKGLVKETLMGTGGTALVSFLNECRERTKEAILQ